MSDRTSRPCEPHPLWFLEPVLEPATALSWIQRWWRPAYWRTRKGGYALPPPNRAPTDLADAEATELLAL